MTANGHVYAPFIGTLFCTVLSVSAMLDQSLQKAWQFKMAYTQCWT